MDVLPDIIHEKLGKKAEGLKFIGGGSYVRGYKAVLPDGEVIAADFFNIFFIQSQ